MTEQTIKDFIVKVYSNLIEESVNSWLKSEGAVVRNKLMPEEQLKLRVDIKEVSKVISEEFAEEIIKQGFPQKEISPQAIKKILNEIIKKNMGRLESKK